MVTTTDQIQDEHGWVMDKHFNGSLFGSKNRMVKWSTNQFVKIFYTHDYISIYNMIACSMCGGVCVQ
jgi:hypothetical protein